MMRQKLNGPKLSGKGNCNPLDVSRRALDSSIVSLGCSYTCISDATACDNENADIKAGACVGESYCTALAGDGDVTIGRMPCIMTASCTGFYDCTDIGELSCIGTSSCAAQATYGVLAVGDCSCIDTEACFDVENAEFGNLALTFGA
jgi:hypothetical protein